MYVRNSLIWAAVLGIGAMVTLLGVAAGSGTLGNREPGSPGDEVAQLSSADGGTYAPSFQAFTTTSWATSYDSVGALTAASDLVIHARVVKLDAANVNGSVEEHTFRSIESEYAVEVLGVGKGSVEAGDTLTVIQLGGAGTAVVQTVEGDPPLSPGQEYVFFLTKDAERDGYWMQGGPIGRMIVSGASASSLSQVDATARSVPDLRIPGRPVESVLREARAHAADPRPAIEP